MGAQKPLDGVLVASDVDGTIAREDTIFAFFEKFGLAEEGMRLNRLRQGSDVRIILERIVSANKVAKADLARVADEVALFPGAKGFYRKLEWLGARVCLLSATYEPIAERIAERIGLENPVVMATKVRLKGDFVGGLDGPVIDGAEKKSALGEVAERIGIPLAKTVGIGDSSGDAEFMEMIEEACGVCFRPTNPVFDRMEREIVERFAGD